MLLFSTVQHDGNNFSICPLFPCSVFTKEHMQERKIQYLMNRTATWGGIRPKPEQRSAAAKPKKRGAPCHYWLKANRGRQINSIACFIYGMKGREGKRVFCANMCHRQKAGTNIISAPCGYFPCLAALPGVFLLGNHSRIPCVIALQAMQLQGQQLTLQWPVPPTLRRSPYGRESLNVRYYWLHRAPPRGATYS